jgi:hypothetical protein
VDYNPRQARLMEKADAVAATAAKDDERERLHPEAYASARLATSDARGQQAGLLPELWRDLKETASFSTWRPRRSGS